MQKASEMTVRKGDEEIPMPAREGVRHHCDGTVVGVCETTNELAYFCDAANCTHH